MIPEQSNEDLLSFYVPIAECSYPGTFNDTLMEVAAEEVVTTSSSEPQQQYPSTTPQHTTSTSTSPSPLKRPTSLTLDFTTKHVYNKTIQRDLSIFNNEEPYIIEDFNKCLHSIHKPFDFTWEMDVAAQEEVITDPIYNRPFTDSERTTVLKESTDELSDDYISASVESSSDYGYSSDRSLIIEDNLKACLPMTPNTEKALVTFASCGNSDMLLPIVKCGPGFDLIDFINNDICCAEDYSPNNLREKSDDCDSDQNCGHSCTNDSIKKNNFEQTSINSITQVQIIKGKASDSAKCVHKKAFSRKAKQSKAAFLRHLDNMNTLRNCNLNTAIDSLKLYRNKRIKNNLSSKMSRDKRKREIQSKFMEFEMLKIKNWKLKNNEENLKQQGFPGAP